MINSLEVFTREELNVASKLEKLKNDAGSHSPSIFTLADKIPELNIKVDACYLSNPYATDLFLSYFEKDLLSTNKIRDILEFYPSQNTFVAESLGNHLSIPGKNIFVGNGAVEIIQAIIHRFTRKKILINIPTFSSYYEFVKDDTEVIFYQLDKKNDFQLDIEDYISEVKKSKPDTIVIINPNNPDGSYVLSKNLLRIIEELKFVDNIIIDESFIHFAFEDDSYGLSSIYESISNYPNVILIKSMSKDFGIAGIRAGYAIMSEERVSSLLSNGFLWNINGLSEYFFNLYVRNDFIEEYQDVRIKYIKNAQKFYNSLSGVDGIKVYPSMANFALFEITNGITSLDFFKKMLIKYGIYTRTCVDKIGLEGEFIRIGCRKDFENEIILESLKDFMNEFH